LRKIMTVRSDDPASPDFYDDSYYRHALHGGHWFRDNDRKHQARMEAVLAALDPDPSDKILDLGCADGRHTRMLAPVVGHIIGIDFSEAAIRIASSGGGDPDRIEFVHADASRMSAIDAASIDKIVAIDFFEHVDDALLERILSECWRVLKPVGRVVFYTPCASHYVERMKAAGFLLRQIPGHIAVRDGHAYRRLAKALPWDSIDISYLPSEYPLFRLIDRMMMQVPLLGPLFRFRVVGTLVKR
jgi:SAM-dependent methyltransferase